MITSDENTAFKFVEAMFIKRKMSLLESKEKATGKRVLIFCVLQDTEDGGADLIPVANMLLPEDNVRIDQLYDMPEGTEARPTNDEDFKTLLRG